MAGQPLSNFPKIQSFRFLAGSLSLKPELARLVMLVIETWSSAEARTFGMVANILQTEPVIATAMLQAVDNMQAQRDAILAGAKAVLMAEEWAVFEAAFLSTNASRNARNRFVHHVWGVTDDLPNALLLHEPKYFHVDRSSSIKRAREIARTPVMNATYKDAEINRDGITVWRAGDLAIEVNAANRAHRIMAILEVMIVRRVCSQSTDSIRKLLLNDPITQQRMHSQSKKA